MEVDSSPGSVPRTLFLFWFALNLKPLVLILIVILIIGGIVLAVERRNLLNEDDGAPNSRTKRTTSESISLADYRGKKNVVLFFYPKDFASGCTKEVCAFRENYAEVMKCDAVLLGVSVNGNESHQAFIENHGLPFPLRSGEHASIGRAYGTTARLGGLLRGS